MPRGPSAEVHSMPRGPSGKVYAEGALGIASNGVSSPFPLPRPGTRGRTYDEGEALPTVTLGIDMPMPTVFLCRGCFARVSVAGLGRYLCRRPPSA